MMASKHWIILASVLLLLAGEALAQDLHCCDYRKEPVGLWHPEPPKCVPTGEPCLLEPPEYEFCIEGLGKYTVRGRYPAPPYSKETGTLNYYCILPEPAELDLPIPGDITPCDQETDCTADNACFNTGGASTDADSDGDRDYCSTGQWLDCNADEHCPEGSTCIDNECTTQAKRPTFLQRLISFIINIFT